MLFASFKTMKQNGGERHLKRAAFTRNLSLLLLQVMQETRVKGVFFPAVLGLKILSLSRFVGSIQKSQRERSSL
jgi:hypothetical protein